MPIYRQRGLDGVDLEEQLRANYSVVDVGQGYVDLRIVITRRFEINPIAQEHYERLTPAEALDVMNAQEALLRP